MASAYPLRDFILIGGEKELKLNPDHLPEPLVMNRECSLITDRHLSGQVIFRRENDHTDVFEVRCTQTPGKDFLVMFPYGKHYAWSNTKKANTMMSIRSHDHGKTWESPRAAFDIDYNQHGFIPLIPKGSSRIYCFGTQPVWDSYTIENGLRENAPIGFFYSDDDGSTWVGPTLIHPIEDPDYTGMSVMRMTETDRGTWLIGTHNAYYWKEAGIKNKKFDLSTYAYVLRSEDQGKTWHILPGKRDEGFQLPEFQRMDEPRVLALGNGEVLLMLRTPEGHLWRSFSRDDGKTWEQPKPTTLIHPDAPPMVFLLSDGKTLVCFHHNRFHNPNYSGFNVSEEITGGDRNEIWVSFSQDKGLTWSEPRFLFANVANPEGDSAFAKFQCSYLDMIQDGDDIHIFVPHLWHEVLHLQISENDLKNAPTKGQIFPQKI